MLGLGKGLVLHVREISEFHSRDSFNVQAFLSLGLSVKVRSRVEIEVREIVANYSILILFSTMKASV